MGGGVMCGRGEVCCRSLIRCADNAGTVFNTVDIFNARSGVWSTAALSVARQWFVATSLPNDGLAFFAGGQGT